MHRHNHRHRARTRRLKRTPLVKRTTTVIDTHTGVPMQITKFGWWTTGGFIPIANQKWAEQEYNRRGLRR